MWHLPVPSCGRDGFYSPLMDLKGCDAFVSQAFASHVLPALKAFVAVPNTSALFNPHDDGHAEEAVKTLVRWFEQQKIEGGTVEVIREEKKTPFIFVEIAASHPSCTGTAFAYGHYDKHPGQVDRPWREGLHPYKAVEENGKLYGRGGADNGYAFFLPILAVMALKAQKLPHGRLVLVFDGGEESGSPFLPGFIVNHLKRIGKPSLAICLDSGVLSYDRLYLTTSLRGLAVGTLRVQMLDQGVHGGTAGGIAAGTFRIVRQLLSRIEDEKTGKLLDELNVPIPKCHLKYTRELAALANQEFVFPSLPFVANGQAVHEDPVELLLNRNWRPSLYVTGIDGLPPCGMASSVARPSTTVKVSIRFPPTLNPREGMNHIKQILERDPPLNAKVEFTTKQTGQGWVVPEFEPWLQTALEDSSRDIFKTPMLRRGGGGSIPFFPFLQRLFPGLQFIVTGVLGPQANAHGPNEMLDLCLFKKLTMTIANVLQRQAAAKDVDTGVQRPKKRKRVE